MQQESTLASRAPCEGLSAKPEDGNARLDGVHDGDDYEG